MVLGKMKFRIHSEEESAKVQNALFARGGRWVCKDGQTVRFQDSPFLYYDNGRLLHGSLEETFGNDEDSEEMTLKQLLEMKVDWHARYIKMTLG